MLPFSRASYPSTPMGDDEDDECEFPDDVKEFLENEFAVTSMASLNEVIAEYEGYTADGDSSDIDTLDKLRAAKAAILRFNSPPEEEYGNNELESSKSRVEEVTDLLLASGFVDEKTLTKNLNLAQRKAKQDPNNDEFIRTLNMLEASKMLCAEYLTLTGSKFVRPLVSDFDASASMSSPSTGASPSVVSNGAHTTVEASFPAARTRSTSSLPSPSIGASVNPPSESMTEIDMSELHSRGSNSVEEYKHLVEEAKSVPPSAEGFLAQLASIALLALHQNQHDVIDELKDLEKKLIAAVEQFRWFTHSEDRDHLSRLHAALEVGDLKKVSDESHILLRSVRPLNFLEVLRLAIATHPATELLRNKKDVVLFLGSTGSGKSTLIKWVGGARMERVHVKTPAGNLVPHLHCVVPPGSRLESFSSSPGFLSETRFVNVLEVEHRSTTFNATDSPGLDDSQSTAVDVSNCKGLKDALSGAYNVRLVVMIGSVLERKEKLILVSNLATVARLLKYPEEDAKSILFVPNNIHSDQKTTYLGMIKEIKIAVSNNQPDFNYGPSVVVLLNALVNQLEDNLWFADPLNQSPNELMSRIAKVPVIENPSDSFNPFLSNSSTHIVAKQLQLDLASIKQVLDMSPINYRFLKFKLDTLKKLWVEMKNSEYERAYTSAMEAVNDYRNDIVKRACVDFDNALSHASMSEFDVNQFVSACDALIALESSLSPSDGISHLNSEALLQERLIGKLEASAKSFEAATQELSYGLEISHTLHNLALLARVIDNHPRFSLVRRSYRVACDSMKLKFQQSILKFKDLRWDSDLSPIALEMDLLSTFSVPQVLEADRRNTYAQARDQLTALFNNVARSTGGWQLMQPFMAPDDQLETAKAFIEAFDRMDSALQVSLASHVQGDSISSAVQHLLYNIEKYFENCCLFIKSRIPSFEYTSAPASAHSDSSSTEAPANEINDFSSLEEYVASLKLLKKFPGLEMLFGVRDSYQSVLLALFHCMRFAQERIDVLIQASFRQTQQRESDDFWLSDENNNINQIRLVMNVLMSASWLSKYQGEVSIMVSSPEKVASRVKKQLLEYAGALLARLKRDESKMKLSNSSCLSKNLAFVERLFSVSELRDLIPELGAKVDEISQWLLSVTQETVIQIQELHKKDARSEVNRYTADAKKHLEAYNRLSVEWEVGQQLLRNSPLGPFQDLAELHNRVCDYNSLIEKGTAHHAALEVEYVQLNEQLTSAQSQFRANSLLSDSVSAIRLLKELTGYTDIKLYQTDMEEQGMKLLAKRNATNQELKSHKSTLESLLNLDVTVTHARSKAEVPEKATEFLRGIPPTTLYATCQRPLLSIQDLTNYMQELEKVKSEILSRNLTLEFEPANLERLTQAVRFLSLFPKEGLFPELHNLIVSIEPFIEFVKQYCSFIRERLLMELRAIFGETSIHSSTENDLKSHSKAVAMLYKELCHFRLDHGDTKEFRELKLIASQYCTEAYDFLKKKHGDILKQLKRADAEQSGKQELLNQVIAVADFEVEFDPFTPTWDTMYYESTSKTQDETKELIDKVRSLISAFNLDGADDEMNKLQSGNETLAANKLGAHLESVLNKNIRTCSSLIISWELGLEKQTSDLQRILTEFKNFENGPGLQILLPYSKLQPSIEKLYGEVHLRLQELILEVRTNSRHRDVSSTQDSVKRLKTTCQLLSNISSSLVPHENLSDLQKTADGAANAIIEEGKLTGFARWFISRPSSQIKKLSPNDHTTDGYEKVLSDNVSGLLEWITEPRIPLRVLDNPNLGESLISILYRKINNGESRADDVWPCFVICRGGESKPTLRFVEDVFISLDNVAPLSSKFSESQSPFESFLDSLSSQAVLAPDAKKRLVDFTGFVMPVLRSQLLTVVDNATAYLPLHMQETQKNRVTTLKKNIESETSTLVEQALSAVSHGNKSNFESVVEKLKKDGSNEAVGTIFEKLGKDVRTIVESALDKLQSCNAVLKGNSSSSASLPFTELQRIYDLRMIDPTCVANQFEATRSKFCETCELVLRSIVALDKPNASAYSLFSNIWAERNTTLIVDLGFGEKKLGGVLIECSVVLKRGEEVFKSSLESISKPGETNISHAITALNALIELQKTGVELARALTLCDLPTDHPLLLTINGMTTGEKAVLQLFEAGDSLHQSSCDFVESLKVKFVEDSEVRRRNLLDLLLSIHLQFSIAKALQSPGLPTIECAIENLGKLPLGKFRSYLTDTTATSSTAVSKIGSKKDLAKPEATAVSNFLTILADFSHSPLNRRISVDFDGVSLEKLVKDCQSQVLDGLTAKRVSFYDSIEWHSTEDVVVPQAHSAIIALMDLVSQFPAISSDLYRDIESVLEKIGSTQNGLVLLRSKLVQSSAGSKIVNKFSAFAGEMAFRFNEATKSISNEAAVKSLSASEFLSDPFNPDSKVDEKIKEIIEKKLLERVDRYQKTYHMLLVDHLHEDVDFSYLLGSCLKLSKKIVEPPTASQSFINFITLSSSKEKIYTTYLPDLLAHVFVTWTLKRAKHYFNANGKKSKYDSTFDSYLLKPKPAQIIAIFRLLGVGDENELAKGFANQLIEVKTGEGKSVTLAVASAVLALLGYHVDVACYSEYMTKRDYASFLDLFETLEVSDRIRYGTFPSLCKDLLNADFNICSRVKDILAGQKPAEVTKGQTGPTRILLIDEVDVFFSRNFYGSLFIPELPFGQNEPVFLALVKEIWASFKHSGSPPSYASVSALPAFQPCVDKFPLITKLLPDAVRFMLAALEDFSQPSYRVESDRIGYPQIDGTLAFDVNYGYKTMWTYFSEHEKGTISKEAMERSVAISLHCGHFSYSEIPRLYSTMMGVTGTLRDMSSAEKEILKQYNISRFAFIPSIYGSSKSTWTPNTDTHVIIRQPNDYDETLKEEFFMTIGREIQSEMLVAPNDPNRTHPGAVLVFFESDAVMEEFKSSSHGVAQFPNSHSLDPNTDASTKEVLVRDATCSGSITYMNCSLGRGTDFICVDPLVLKRGGVKVIQTHLSKEKSEETQIRGRTGRQGQPGRYVMVLSSDQLEKLDITAEMLAEAVSGSQKYAKLDEARNAFFLREYQSNSDQVTFAQSEHLQATKFLANLSAGSVQEVLKFVENQNRAPIPPSNSPGRVLIAIDGTGSMSSCITKTKTAIGQTFFRLDKVLKEAGINEGAFKMQFVVYRNYNAPPDKLLECSGWSQNPFELERWLSSISAGYGLGNEAIEVALQYALELASEPDGIAQIVIIGDAPPNTPMEVSARRPASLMNTTRFSTAVTSDGEIAKLVRDVNGVSTPIPISCFAVAPRNRNPKISTVAAFQAISSRTLGAYKTLDVFSEDASEHLTRILSERVLTAVAKDDAAAAEALIKIYERTDWATHRG